VNPFSEPASESTTLLRVLLPGIFLGILNFLRILTDGVGILFLVSAMIGRRGRVGTER
jgi:hypothetical protein